MVRTVDTGRVVQKRLRRLHRVYDAALGYVLSLNADYVLRYIVGHVGEVLEFDYTFVMLVDPEGSAPRALRLQMAWNAPDAKADPSSWMGVLEAEVVETRSPMLIPDAREYPALSAIRDGDLPVSLVSIPLVYRDKVIGTLTGASLSRREFHPQEVVALTQLATPASLAIENERLYTNVRERLREKEVLLEGSAALAGKREIGEVLATLATQMARVMEDAWCGLLLREGEGLRLHAWSSWDVSASIEAAARQELNPDGKAGGRPGGGFGALSGGEVPGVPLVAVRESASAMEALNAMVLQPIDLAEPGDPLARMALDQHARSAFLIPLLHLGRARGLALVVTRNDDEPLAPGHARILQALANQAAVAIENAQLLGEEKRQSEEKVLLLEAARLAASSLHAADGMQGFAEMSARCLGAAQCIILRGDDEARELRFCASWGLPETQRTQMVEILSFMLAREVFCKGVHESQRPRIESGLDEVELGPSERLIVTMCGARTLGVWPMVSQGPCSGLIMLLFREPREFSRRQVDLMYGVVRQASIFMRNASLFEQVKERAERLQAISDLTETINSTRDLTSIFSIVARNMRKIVQCDWSGLAILERERNVMRFPVMSSGDGSELSVPHAYPLAESLVHDAVIGKRPIIRDDISDIDSKLEARLSAQGIHSLVVIPLLVDHSVIATLNLGSRKRSAFDTQQIESLQEMADHLAMAIKNASMFEEISRINQELRQMDAIKSDFLSTVAHELRTPLTIIKGYLFVLLKDPKRFEESVLDMLDTVDSQADHLKELIENLLSLSRLEANRGLLKLHVQPVRLDLLADEICSNFRLAAKKKGITLTADVPSGLEVKADRGMLVRVFYNLVGNAMKFTAEGGITIRMRILENGMVECVVEDTGAGIAAEHLSRIFERFFHVDGPDRRNPTGTGLGLAIVKQIVAAHGGEARVTSEVGKGTRFIFTLATDPPAQA
jgi:signal transduction histidine kinase